MRIILQTMLLYTFGYFDAFFFSYYSKEPLDSIPFHMSRLNSMTLFELRNLS